MKKFKIIRSTTNSHVNGYVFFIDDVSIGRLYNLPSISNVDVSVTDFSGDKLVLKNSHITVVCKLIE